MKREKNNTSNENDSIQNLEEDTTLKKTWSSGEKKTKQLLTKSDKGNNAPLRASLVRASTSPESAPLRPRANTPNKQKVGNINPVIEQHKLSYSKEVADIFNGKTTEVSYSLELMKGTEILGEFSVIGGAFIPIQNNYAGILKGINWKNKILFLENSEKINAQRAHNMLCGMFDSGYFNEIVAIVFGPMSIDSGTKEFAKSFYEDYLKIYNPNIPVYYCGSLGVTPLPMGTPAEITSENKKIKLLVKTSMPVMPISFELKQSLLQKEEMDRVKKTNGQAFETRNIKTLLLFTPNSDNKFPNIKEVALKLYLDETMTKIYILGTLFDLWEGNSKKIAEAFQAREGDVLHYVRQYIQMSLLSACKIKRIPPAANSKLTNYK